MELSEVVDKPATDTAMSNSDYGSTGSVNGNGIASPQGDTSRLLPAGRSTPVMNSSGNHSDGYEELFKDSVPCPSCRGLGRVPREQENQLVALIPMRDKRLKPRRTVQYVIMAITLCLLIGGLLMFFLFPRSVVVTSNRPLLSPVSLHLNTTASFVNFTVMNFYNFTNNNFYSINILGAQLTALYDEKIMASASNKTKMEVPIKSADSYGVLINFVLSKENGFGFLVSFCEDSRPWVHNFPVTFELFANYTYMGHVEQATLTTYQQVSCYNETAYLTPATTASLP